MNDTAISLAIVHSRGRIGLEAPPITVEAHLHSGLPTFNIVGLPETAVRESKDRVRSAIINSNFRFPDRRITVNLAPADSPKEGCRFDLAIAISILCASGQLSNSILNEYEFLGELSLGGGLRPVPGTLLAAKAATQDLHKLIVSAANASEAALVTQAQVFGAKNLLSVCAHLTNIEPLERTPQTKYKNHKYTGLRLSDIRGQEFAKRVLIVAATGAHNLLMTGPPGTGKTMLAECLPRLLPPLTEAEKLEVVAVYSAFGKVKNSLFEQQRPFRAPHHSASMVSLIGGGQVPFPGEISMAHRGVLFLDEIPEFSRGVLESLREPLESGYIELARTKYRVRFPARFQLLAAMNPCPSGKSCNGDEFNCKCSPESKRKYLNRLSAPLLDRIDMRIQVQQPHQSILFSSVPKKDDNEEELIRSNIIQARELAITRNGKANQNLSPVDIEQHCKLTSDDRVFFVRCAEKLKMSLRGCHRVLRVARTIADLQHEEKISKCDLEEALAFRTDFSRTA